MKYDIKVKVGKDELSFGKGVILLMQKVEKYGSLSAAYKEMNMSSSKAWKILNKAQNDLGFALLESHAGGKDGGSTRLTAKGKEIMEKYNSMMAEIDKFTFDTFQKYFEKGE